MTTQFFEWKLSQKNHTTEEIALLIPYNCGTTITTHATTYSLVEIYPTNNNLDEEGKKPN